MNWFIAHHARRTAIPLALCLVVVHTAQAGEIYLARAIGEPSYLPDAAPPPPPEPRSFMEPPKLDDRPTSNLPGLGSDKRGTTLDGPWKKILIGVALVAAMAVIGNKGGGGTVSMGGGGGDTGGGGGGGGGGSDPGPVTVPPGNDDGGGDDDGGGAIDLPDIIVGGDDDDDDDDDDRRRRRRDRD